MSQLLASRQIQKTEIFRERQLKMCGYQLQKGKNNTTSNGSVHCSNTFRGNRGSTIHNLFEVQEHFVLAKCQRVPTYTIQRGYHTPHWFKHIPHHQSPNPLFAFHHVNARSWNTVLEHCAHASRKYPNMNITIDAKFVMLIKLSSTKMVSKLLSLLGELQLLL